jgi:hypothetical protein
MVNRFILVLIAVFFFMYSFLIDGYLTITSIGLSFSLFIFLDFINKLGNELPIKEFILSLASFQWIVGAKISYNLGKQHYKYYMYVSEVEYMGYIVPAVILFYVGIKLFPQKLLIEDIKNIVEDNTKVLKRGAITLVILGLSSTLISRFYQGGLSFLLFLAETLLYIGLSYFLFIYKNYKYLITLSTLGVILLLAINKGSFHKLLLVGSFLSFFTFSSQFKFFHKLFVISIGATLIFVIQTVKNDFRDIIWRSNTGQNPIVVFWDLVQEEFTKVPSENLSSNGEDEETKDQAELNVRLNQGWIISKVLENVPKNVPFQNGKTITESIEASVLPRFLFPDKMGAEQGLENFRKISGLELNKSTSMELSIVAEFYANYGYIGGQIAMFLYGLFLAFLIRFIAVQLGNGSALIYLWFILFFIQPVKAEIDFIKIINHLIKAIVFFIFIKYLLIQLFGYELFIDSKDE